MRSAEFRRNPYPTYAELRTHDPLHDNPLGFVLLTRYEDCLAVFRDNRFGREGFEQLLQSMYGKEGQNYRLPRSMLFSNPPDHTRLRSLVNRAFTSRVIEGLRTRIQGLVADLLDRQQGAREMDLIDAFAYPLPFTVICDMLGVPLVDQPHIRSWSNDISRSLDAYGRPAPELAIRGNIAMRKLEDYFRDLIAVRRRTPRDDLLGLLILAEEAGDRLSMGELLQTCMLLFVAGHETTVNLIGNGMLALLSHPQQLALLRARPELIGDAVEEMLRYDPPLQSTARIAIEDIEFKDRVFEKGSIVHLSIGAASRDPAQFPDPDRFDIQRPESRHLTFGFGIHFCLGAMLARMEAQVAIDMLVKRMPGLALSTETPEWQDSLTLRGLQTLPVTW
jgi:cytochrome P450